MNGQAMYADVQRQGGNDFLADHAPLVKRIAYHLMGRLPSSVQVEDLIQAGMLGLLEAAQKFDASQGASFETYAGIRIRGAMIDEIRGGDWTPRSVHRKVREVSEAVRKVERRNGSEAKDSEVAAEMGISLDEYHDIIRDAAGAKIFSVEDSEVSDDYREGLAADSADNPDKAFHNGAFNAALAQAIENLPERERLVMSLYYVDELNLREIGEVLSVSESRVCQIHGQALVRLRARLGDWTAAD